MTMETAAAREALRQNRQRSMRSSAPRELHVDGAAAGDDGRVLERAAHDHDRVVQRALRLVDELVAAAAQDHRRGARARAALEQVEALRAHLGTQPSAATHHACMQCTAFSWGNAARRFAVM
jgi:hypothetical protein